VTVCEARRTGTFIDGDTVDEYYKFRAGGDRSYIYDVFVPLVLSQYETTYRHQHIISFIFILFCMKMWVTFDFIFKDIVRRLFFLPSSKYRHVSFYKKTLGVYYVDNDKSVLDTDILLQHFAASLLTRSGGSQINQTYR
jgi:hypothetical protein